MELTVTQENLTRALTAVGRVASTKTQLPILSNILLRTDGTRLLIAATNLEIAATQLIGAKIAKPGSITIPAKLVAEFVASLPKGNVELLVKNDHLHIKAGTYSSVINGIASDDFPELPVIDEKKSIQYSISTDEFKQAVSQTILVASNDSTRPVLTGVYWHSFEGNLYLAATDGYRLTEKRLVETKSDVSAIIPASSLQEVLRSITDDATEVELLFDETQVRFRLGEAEITSRLIDGNFPDYRQLIPASSESVIKIDKAEFVRITKIASLFARDSGGSVTVTANAEAGTLAIHSIASQLGENTSESAADVSADGQVTLNSRYLADALSVTSGDKVVFRFSGRLAPCVLSVDKKDNDYQHIIMPLKS
ncbi:TPA: DNA polymerase III subunit beta [Candidatus Saccharibacteria bacterium]|nr:MAG: polymerase III (beta subunit) protein [Candidatus Saccharibacteria bacterium GW2011_GWC2_44_17]MBH1956991.1 DNA polymerase III subunit beta [Candidatus Saccharibacteria bacterium]OGL33641.1 MAG: DNA polymerase III subunit beta [Candidatus Saccharibacteria bacterium RIFCSPHIGHO2_12_FULL_47_16]MBH1973221.1 DNA polymerase III subunit beta [Candidatus Saccharibacteria bacterium]MBH1990538.1 DNA polymerase III subunit beta [Candidatus Saccharibacteria bacterium]